MGSTANNSRISLALLGVVTSIIVVPFIDPLGALKNAILWLIQQAVEGLTGLAGWFVLSTMEAVLFFPAPTDIEPLTDMYWGLTFPLFWGLLSISGAAFFGFAQLFPESDKADLDRFMKRVLIAVVLLFSVGFGFGYVVDSIHLIAEGLYPTEYRIAITMDTFEGMATGAFTGFALIIFAVLTSPKIVITYGLFLLMLGMRMIITYTTYALFPILIAFWIVDVGPMKYGKMMAGMMFKATILLLLFGILLAAILGVGGALAGDTADLEGDVDEGFNVDEVISGETDENRLAGGLYEDSEDNPHFSSDGQSSMTNAWVSVYSYFAAIWLCITITSMILGGSISTGFKKNMNRGAKIEKAGKKAKSRIQEARGKGDGPGNKTPGGGGSGAPGEDSNNGLSDDAAPEPDKADDDDGRLAGAIKGTQQRVSDAKETVSEGKEAAKQKAEEGADEIAEKGSQAGTKLEEGITKAGESAGGAAGAAGAAIGKAAGKTAGKAANVGVSALAKTPKAAMKGANLAKLGGSAYMSVWKQPDARSSIGEMGRIARSSPIGKPSGGSGGEQGAAGLEGASTGDFDTGDGGDGPSMGGDDPSEDEGGGFGDGGEESSGEEDAAPEPENEFDEDDEFEEDDDGFNEGDDEDQEEEEEEEDLTDESGGGGE